MIDLPTINELLLAGEEPRVHGNGFIQLDLPDGSRLHVWDDAVPRQEVSSSIHDHAFGFNSTVICGKLVNIEYILHYHLNGFYAICTPQRREGTEDTKLMPTGQRANLTVLRMDTYTKGQSYHFEPLVFHDTQHDGLTATIMRKTERLQVEPRVLVPFGTEPDNEFDRDSFDPGILWPIIDRALEASNED
jgi:hypothetical protein